MREIQIWLEVALKVSALINCDWSKCVEICFDKILDSGHVRAWNASESTSPIRPAVLQVTGGDPLE